MFVQVDTKFTRFGQYYEIKFAQRDDDSWFARPHITMKVLYHSKYNYTTGL
jgi:hypothetical protein